MASTFKRLQVIRRNWKKSAFGALALAYGVQSLKNKYDINLFMKACCKEAEKYGNQPLPVAVDPRAITIILNPAANKRSAKSDYEKYCEPLLHLAGISVNLLQTTSVGHAKELVSTISENEPIIIAGGDGTLSEALTGILRQNKTKRIIGILPVGRINNVGNEMFPLGNELPKVKQLTSATMAIIQNNYKPIDVMKIDAISKDNEPAKSIFALSRLEWGAFRDAFAKRDKYWIYGGLRDYVTYIFNGYKNSLSWECKGTLKMTPPCNGCKNCQIVAPKEHRSFRMLDFIMPKTKDVETEENFSDVSNEQCGYVQEKQFKTVNLNLFLKNGDSANPTHLLLSLSKPKIGYFDFVSEGWKRVNKKIESINENILAGTVELTPDANDAEAWYEIDNEEYDVKPIKISILRKAINMYCAK